MLSQLHQPRAAFAVVPAVVPVLLLGGLLLSGCEPGEDTDPELLSRASTQDAQAESPGPVRDFSPERGLPRVPADHPVTDRPKIVAFGNSLTAGLGVAPEQSYPARLQRRLADLGYPHRVINAGVSGDTTAGGLRRVDWVLKSRPAVVILELGGNDGLRGISPDETRKNLEHIIQRFQAAGVTVLLAGMKLPPNYGQAYITRFEAVFPELARRYQLPFMPFFLEGVATQSGLNQADGIHPTGEGYGVIVDNLLPRLEPLLSTHDRGATQRRESSSPPPETMRLSSGDRRPAVGC